MKIIQQPDKRLRTISKEVQADEFNTAGLNQLIDKMQRALEREPDGVALAAPQIGVNKRIFLVSHRAFSYLYGKDGDYQDKIFINPRLVHRSQKTVSMEEGCLSVRWWYGKVKRSSKVRLEAYDRMGQKFTWNASGLMAQIFQHETDHLEGVLFTDKAKDLGEIEADQKNN